MVVDPLWMAAAKRASLMLQASTRGTRGAGHSVYVVMLHDHDFSRRHGLYVGQASRDPDGRFNQYKSGFKVNEAVRRFGTQLPPASFEHLNKLQQWELLEIEAALL